MLGASDWRRIQNQEAGPANHLVAAVAQALEPQLVAGKMWIDEPPAATLTQLTGK